MMISIISCGTTRRLLRNRVSAQQARERKKSYVSNLEAQAKQSEQLVSLLSDCLCRENIYMTLIREGMHRVQELACLVVSVRCGR